MKQFDYNKYLKNNPLLKEGVNEASEVYTDWREYVNPDYILVTLKNGKKLKIEKKRIQGGQKVYQAILQAFNDEKHAVTDKLVNAMTKQLGEGQLNEFDATSFFQGQMIQQAMQSAPQAMSEADKIITYVLMTVGVGAVAGGLAAIAKDKLGSLNPIPAIKQWWADRQKRKALEPIVAKLKKDPEVMKYVANRNMKGIQAAIKSKLSPEEQKYIGSLTRDALSESQMREKQIPNFTAGDEIIHYFDTIPAFKQYRDEDAAYDDIFYRIPMSVISKQLGWTQEDLIKIDSNLEPYAGSISWDDNEMLVLGGA